MLQDKEGNKIILQDKPNGHLLILGKSGSGKTYFACRKIEEEYQKNKRILVFDYSGSYTSAELKKTQFQYLHKTRICDPQWKHLDWMFMGEKFQQSFTDALIKGLKTHSYYQKKLLRESIGEILNKEKEISFPLLMEKLEQLEKTKKDSESVKNIAHLLTRLEPYSDIDEIHFLTKRQGVQSKIAEITIVQLSDYAEMQRSFLTEVLMSLFWQEVRSGNKKADIVLLDEFQNISVLPGSTVSSILREGRKFGISAYLSTQFLGNFDKEAVDTLMQAGNILFFRPTEKETKQIADLIDSNQIANWRKLLGNLQIGEGVIKGRYQINNSSKEIENPIIFKVQEVEQYEK